MKRDRRARLAKKTPQLPSQNRPHRIRNVLALSDTSEPELADLGRSEPVSEDLIWWLSDEWMQGRTLFFAGDGVEEWLQEAGFRRFEPMVSNGQTWYVRVRRNGARDTGRWRLGKSNYQLLGFSKDQYALIRWALWMRNTHGWKASEILAILTMFWEVHLGQAPLSTNKVESWNSFQSVMRSKGLQWP